MIENTAQTLQAPVHVPLPERTADELLALHRACLDKIGELEVELAEYAGYVHVPVRITGELMYQHELLERLRAYGMAARTREIRAADLNVAPFTYTSLATPEQARARDRTRNAPYND